MKNLMTTWKEARRLAKTTTGMTAWQWFVTLRAK